MELWFGLIFPIINSVFMLILCPIIFWRWLSQEKRCNILEKGSESARKEAKKSAEALWEMRERCRNTLISLHHELMYMLLHDYPSPGDRARADNRLFELLHQMQAIWSVYEESIPFDTSIPSCYGFLPYPIRSWAGHLHDKIMLGLESGVTTGHLATWRTEIAAAQVWLIQLDGRGRLGQNGGRRQFSDDEIRELVPLKGGMRWIINQRTSTGNCPFPFGPYIERDLEALIARIEALESAPA